MTAAVIMATGSDRRLSLGLAAAVAVEAAAAGTRSTLLIEAGPGAQRRGPTLLAAPSARQAEDALRAAGLSAAARGHICHLALDGGDLPLAELPTALQLSTAEVAVAHLPASLWVQALEQRQVGAVGGCVLVSLPEERSLAALAVHELVRRRLRVRIATRPPAPLAARRALAGVRAGGRGSEIAGRIARALLGSPARRQSGQAMPAVLGAGVMLIGAALALAAIGGAVTGKGRAQRAADLAALSAARSMRDDIPRLLAPPTVPGGGLNPRHLTRPQYLARARLAADQAARENGVSLARLRLDFPDATANPPLRVRASIQAEIDPHDLLAGGESDQPPIPVAASAVAEASPPTGSWSGMPEQAQGGGYSGPLAYRNGEGMRPDVAAAYDRMAAAARRAGLGLVVVSGFRSDAEQAELFQRHPDPRWVAPPGHSLHRCATELDLGPASAYA